MVPPGVGRQGVGEEEGPADRADLPGSHILWLLSQVPTVNVAIGDGAS